MPADDRPQRLEDRLVGLERPDDRLFRRPRVGIERLGMPEERLPIALFERQHLEPGLDVQIARAQPAHAISAKPGIPLRDGFHGFCGFYGFFGFFGFYRFFGFSVLRVRGFGFGVL